MDNEYLTISALNNYIKSLLDKDSFLNKVYLKGEISNFKNHTTGHLYFTLKDDESRINAVMFNGNAKYLEFKPEDGMNVLIIGRVSAYPVTGSYQIYVETMVPDGIGNLYIEFEKLKKKLASEGLFNPEHKKEIPKYPTKIGVVTAPTGAAVKDIMSTIKRRFPSCEVILFPSLVQGKDAAPNIVEQIKKADSYNLDTIIVGRGGGSIEDLWAFNEEIVARTIYECKTPIISGVGHEIDFTIADFVADLRAPTPTGAAEMSVPTVKDTINIINQFKIRLNKNIKNMVNTKYIALRTLKQSYVLKNPMGMYEVKMQKLDTLTDSLNKDILQFIENKKYDLDNLKNNYVLKNPELILDKYKHNLALIINSLKGLNPLGILEKGYSVIKNNDKVIKSSKDIKIDDIINVRLFNGEINAKVKEIIK
jgi:exodeoxyribonuclease VII large subunit